MAGVPDETLPPRLLEALRNRNLLVITGAGISMAPPSNLPSWWDFNNALFDAIRMRAGEALPYHGELLQRLTLTGRIPVGAFSDMLVRTFAGDGYFPLLTALEGAEPNSNHLALATLAENGVASDIITFNFDTLIEQAFRESDVLLEVLVRPEDYDRLDLEPLARPRLHKVHGSVTDAASLIDTVSQKLRGLAYQRRLLLKSLFKGKHILFLGFSGADFDFGSDYLPMPSNREGRFGFTWLYRGAPPTIAERLAYGDGVFLAGTLPEFFERLGIAVRPSSKSAAPAADIRLCLDAWTAQPQVGPWACAALCQHLAAELSDESLSQTLSDALAERLVAALREDHFDLTMTGVARRLALAALSAGDTKRSLMWSTLELQGYDATIRVLKENNVEPSAETKREYLRNTANALSNVGLAHAYGGQTGGRDAARNAFLEAQVRLQDAQDDDTMALLLFNMAEHLETEPDRKLRALRQARAVAQSAGAARTQVEAIIAEAKLLIELSEIDRATELAALASSLLPISGSIRHVWQHALICAEAAARRGEWEKALTVCEAALAANTPGPNLAQSIALNLRRILAFNPKSLDRLSTLLIALGQPGDAPLAPLRIVAAETSSRQEMALREAIANAEMQGSLTDLVRLFSALCSLKHADSMAERLIDVAYALQKAAQRVNSHQDLIVAAQYLGIGYELQGDLGLAAAAFRSAIAMALESGHNAGHCQVNLADVIWQQGDIASAEQMFTEGRANLERAAEWSQLAVATVKHGRRLIESDRGGEAIALAHQTAELLDTKDAENLSRALRSTAISWVSEIGLSLKEVAHLWSPGLEELPSVPLFPEQLGNLAIREIVRGDADAARKHIEEALALYRRFNDPAGESRSLSNLAQLHASLGEWSHAIDVTRRALVLRERAGDIEGQVLVLSNLASLLLQTEELEEAVNTARECLHRGPRASHSWPSACAQVVLTRALIRLNRWGDARVACSAALEELRNVDHPERDSLTQEIDHVAAKLTDIERESQRHFDVSPMAMQVLRTARSHGAPGPRAEALQLALSHTKYNEVDRATLLGEYGNALVESGSLLEALAAYDEARRAYDAAGHTGMAWHTRVVMANALARGGDHRAAETAMIEILRDCPVAKVRANLLTGYVNLVFQNRPDDTATIDDLRLRLRDVVASVGIDVETLGRAMIQLAQCEWALDDSDAARSRLDQAKALLVRSNSPQLPKVFMLEAAYKEAASD